MPNMTNICIEGLEAGTFLNLAKPQNITPYFPYLTIWKRYELVMGEDFHGYVFPRIEPPGNTLHDQVVIGPDFDGSMVSMILTACCLGCTVIIHQPKKIVVH